LNGNRVTRTINGTAGSFGYDRRGRNLSAGPATFELNDGDVRTAKVEAGVRTEMVMEGLKLHAEIANSATVAKYRWGLQLIGETRSGQAKTILQDSQRSPVIIADQNGSITDRVRYTAAGEVRQRSGSSPLAFGYGGYLTQSGTDELYAFARTYSPGLARFNESDPLRAFDPMMAMGSHRYVLGYGNTLRFVDPDGRISFLSGADAYLQDTVKSYDTSIDRAVADGSKARSLGNGIGKGLAYAGSVIVGGLNTTSNLLAQNYYGGDTYTQARRELDANEAAVGEVFDGTAAAGHAIAADPWGSAQRANAAVERFGDNVGRGDPRTLANVGEFVGGVIATPGASTGTVRGLMTEMRGMADDLASAARAASQRARSSSVIGESSSGPKIVACAAGSCFVAGTLVHTAEGYKAIEQVQVGELVASRNELTGESTWRRVEQVIITTDREVWDYVFVDDQGKSETLGATPNHPFHTPNGEWVDVGALALGAEVSSLDGRKLTLVSKTMRDTGQTTYNFEVAEDHNYFVGTLGFWVHNGGPGDCCPTAQPTVVPDYGSGRGRRGTVETRMHIDQVRDDFLRANPRYKHVAGGTARADGRKLPEEYLPGPNNEKKGGSYADLTFEAPDGSRIRINTVDTESNGVMTVRERENFDRIYNQTGESVIAIPKPIQKPLQNPEAPEN
jgi:RHS repeat-associated protein